MTDRELWHLTPAFDAPRLDAEELPSGKIRLKWVRPGGGGYHKLVLGELGVRDDLGHIDPELVADVRRALGDYHEAWGRGTTPKEYRAALNRPTATGKHRLTIADGFRLYREAVMTTKPKKVLAEFDLAVSLFVDHCRRGDVLRWADTTVNTPLMLARRSAAREWPNGHSGHRTTRHNLMHYFSAATWLRNEKLIPVDSAPRPMKWRDKVKQVFSEAGKRTEVRRDRYTRDEFRLIWTNREKGDPRIRRALNFLPGARPSALLRMRRSSIRLGDHVPGFFGTITFDPDAYDEHERTKKTPEILIDAVVKAELDQAWAEGGDLHKLEGLYLTGEITDYSLFPTGKRGPEWLGRAIGADTFPKLWREFEAAVGVEHVTLRGWYGTRRIVVDSLPDGMNPEARNNLLGWVKGSQVPDLIYADPDSTALAIEGREGLQALLAGFEGEEVNHEARRLAAMNVVRDADAALIDAILKMAGVVI
jgi:integrase